MRHYLLNQSNKYKYLLVLCDAVIVAAGIFLSYSIRIYLNQGQLNFDMLLERLNPWHIMIIPSHLFTLYVFDLYNLDQLVNSVRSSVMVVMSVLSAGLVISGIFFFLPKYVFGRQVLLIHLLVLSVSLVSWRLLYTGVLAKRSKPKRLAVVGGGQIVSSFIEEIGRIQNSGFRVDSLCILDGTSTDTSHLTTSPRKHGSVLSLLDSSDFDVLAFDSTSKSFSNREIRRILQVKYRNKAVYDLPSLYKNLTGKVPLTYIDGQWLLSRDGLQGQANVAYVRVKRILDVLLSIFLIGLLWPLCLIIGFAIKFDSKGKIFFVQERLGLQRRPFKCVKFRTMVEDAESQSGPIWSTEGDPRITRVGRLLRKGRLDELPQLWNILKGDMSFVGPRPIREHFANELAEKIPFYGLRFSVKPGLSGWAQVNYDYAGSEEGQLEKFQYELFYIQNMSLFLDLLTVFKTVRKVFTGEGR